MIYIDKNRLDNFDRFQRGNLINCLTGTKPALLIATQSREGVNNLALFSNVFHLGADPSMIGFVQRPLTSYSHTYKNIIETGWFTVNHINESLTARAHHTSAKFPDGWFAALATEWPTPPTRWPSVWRVETAPLREHAENRRFLRSCRLARRQLS